MSYNKTWMHRAFPNLSKKEAERIVDELDGRDTSDLSSLILIAEKLRARKEKAVPQPNTRLEVQEFDRQFVFGSAPIPDLATAEYVRHELQLKLAIWLGDFARIQDRIAVNLLATTPRTVQAHRRRCLLWHLAKGEIGRRGIIDELSKKLGTEPYLCSEYNFSSANKKLRTREVRELIKDMRRDRKLGGRAYLLSEQEETKIRTWLSFHKMENDPPPNKM